MEEKPKRRSAQAPSSMLFALAIVAASVGCQKPIEVRPMETRCPDCDAAHGQLHERFCSKERCPFCGRQLATCGCINTVLDLKAEERNALEDYYDDEEEPLKGIVARWNTALVKKGRVPF
jgi:hypothetical protein